jgi:hypothetical protein
MRGDQSDVRSVGDDFGDWTLIIITRKEKMSTLTFDTLKFANRLKTAGVPAGQAEAEADALSEVLETNLSELATKEDLRHEIGDLRHEMKESASALRQEMSGMKFELLKWMIGLAVAQAGLIIGLLKFFPINS